MKIIKTAIEDLIIIEPTFFGDDRGFFYESYNKKELKNEAGIDVDFVQDNHSRSSKDVLRGLHYQLQNPQAKLVRVTSGEVYDVAVDLRKSSKTFGKWVGVLLSEQNKRLFYIPEGFAHGFLVLSKSADFLYKTTSFYDPQSERCLAWNDADLRITWPLKGVVPLVSAKDKIGQTFKMADYYS